MIYTLSKFLTAMVGIIVAISIHEYGHALVAYMLGDDTAKQNGRMTIDPIKHIDLLGMLMLIIFRFGWAKPVPIDPNKFKNYRVGTFLVSIAGVVFNIITAIIFIIILKYVNIYAVQVICTSIVTYNIAFAAFNLLPIPPLDGWGIITSFLPLRFYELAYRIEGIGSIILMAMLFTKTSGIILTPIYNVILKIVYLFV